MQQAGAGTEGHCHDGHGGGSSPPATTAIPNFVGSTPLRAFLVECTIEDADAESTAFKTAGGKLVGIHWMHDKSEEAMRAALGCTASYEFDTDLHKHIDLFDPIAPTVPPAEGSPGRW